MLLDLHDVGWDGEKDWMVQSLDGPVRLETGFAMW